MRAAILTAFGPPDVLQIAEVPTPVAKDHDVLIRVHATSVNFGDTLVRNFAAISPRAFHMPWLFWLIGKLSFGFRSPRVRVLGSEFSGTVEAVGNRVTLFKTGDAVFGYRGPRMGAYAEYLCMPERGVLAMKPSNLTDEEAAACPYGAMMALDLLRKIRLQAGQRVLVVGASGGIGPMIVQLAKHHFGATVAGVCSTARLAFVKSLGATTVIDYTQEDFADRSDTYDVIIDVLGKSAFSRCRRILAPHGRLVFVSFKMRQVLQMLWTPVVSTKRVRCAVMSERQTDLDTVRALVEAGALRPTIDRVFPLERAAEAHRYAESGAKQGAVVISVRPRADAVRQPESEKRMEINGNRVWVGGLAAGLVIIVSAGLMVPVVGTQMDAVLQARGLRPLGVSAMIYFPLLSLTFGVLLVWLYAAVLPRLGPGPKTAALVAVLVWFLAYVSSGVAMVIYGFMPISLSVVGMAWGLVELVIAGQVGSRLYREA